MGIEGAFLRKVPGLFFILLALVSQLYLGRRLKISQRSAWLFLTFGYVLPSFILLFEIVKDPPAPINYWLENVGAVLTIWGWLADFTAVVFFVRGQLPKGFSAERRRFLNTTAAIVSAAPAVALTTGFLFRKDFHVQEIDLKVAGLAKDLNGLRLLQLSDIHLGVYFSADDLRRVVDASNGLRADLGFITGDLITTVSDPIDDCLRELKRLKVASGFWGCMGNHEFYAKNSDYIAEQGRRQDLTFLRHQAQSLTFGTSRVNLAGVDHQFKGKGYLKGVEQLVKPGEFNVLLSHNPDVFPVADRQGFQLTLSGHTHGGQINVEVAHTNLNIVDLVTPYTKGLYQRPASSLYVTSGLGTIGVPVRLGAPPEITLIRLCAS